jgi:hypothetical protein
VNYENSRNWNLEDRKKKLKNRRSIVDSGIENRR